MSKNSFGEPEYDEVFFIKTSRCFNKIDYIIVIQLFKGTYIKRIVAIKKSEF